MRRNRKSPTEETRRKISDKLKIWCQNNPDGVKLRSQANRHGSSHWMWKGDNVGLDGLHEWVRDRKPKPDLCEKCKTTPPYDLANISGQYHRDVNDFEWLCRRCHMESDGRILKNPIKVYSDKDKFVEGVEGWDGKDTAPDSE